MTTTSELRHQLREELEYRGITDTRVLDAIEADAREICSSPRRCAAAAYDDSALPIGNGQTISQPYIVALMTAGTGALTGDENVLEVGTGSGYQTAILARFAGSVVTIERIASAFPSRPGRCSPRWGFGTSPLSWGTARSAIREHGAL